MDSLEISIKLHASIPINKKEISKIITDEMTVLEAIIKTLSSEDELLTYLVQNNTIKPSFLILENKKELRTTKVLEEKLRRNMDIRIIPISHGG